MRRYLGLSVGVMLLVAGMVCPVFAADITLQNTNGTKTTLKGVNGAADVRLDVLLTYAVGNTFTPPATPTDMITVTGSASKTIRVWSLHVCTTNTAAGSQEFRLIKRSTADTGGTAVASTLVPLNATSAAATATVNHYTANPGALGTAVGTVNIVRWASPIAVPGAMTVPTACQELLPTGLPGQGVVPVVLNGIAEQLAVNFNGAALVAGQTHAFRVTVTEE